MARLTVAQERSLESTEEVLALLVRLGRDLERIEQADAYRERVIADARVTIGRAQRAVMTVTGYPYQREQEERVTA